VIASSCKRPSFRPATYLKDIISGGMSSIVVYTELAGRFSFINVSIVVFICSPERIVFDFYLFVLF